MDFTRLNSIIEQHRMLTSMSSLPVVLNEKVIVWFNFGVEDENELTVVEVYNAYKMFDDMVVNEVKLSKKISINLEECEEPELEEEEYVLFLKNIYSNFSKKEMMNLIKKSVIKPLIDVYEAVINELEACCDNSV